ncbi:hypothetical protein OY671_009442, partial [Metschnikowia pulcherrima]
MGGVGPKMDPSLQAFTGRSMAGPGQGCQSDSGGDRQRPQGESGAAPSDDGKIQHKQECRDPHLPDRANRGARYQMIDSCAVYSIDRQAT